MKIKTTYEGVLTRECDYGGDSYYYLDDESFNKLLEDFTGQTIKITIEVAE